MILIPALQPIVYGITSEVLAYEALARWFHNGQIIGPSDLEAEPLWSSVDIQMLSSILARADTIADVAPRLFVNVGKGTVSNAESLSRWIESIAEITHNTAFSIVIEITEGIEDVQLQEAWPRLKRLGVKLALDDFGDGLSSRSRLVRYDWDYCKFEANTVMQKPMQDAIRYCKNSGVLPVVERVERQRESEEFAAMGLHWQQGFLHGRPTLIDDLQKGQGAATYLNMLSGVSHE